MPLYMCEIPNKLPSSHGIGSYGNKIKYRILHHISDTISDFGSVHVKASWTLQQFVCLFDPHYYCLSYLQAALFVNTMEDPDTVMNITLDPDSDNGIERIPPSDDEELEIDTDSEIGQIVRNIQNESSDSNDGGPYLPENDSEDSWEDNIEGDNDHDDGDHGAFEIADERYPPRPMNLVSPPEEYDIDFDNGWDIIMDEDPGYVDGTPPFMGAMSTNVPGTSPMDYFDFLFSDSMWGEIALQTNDYAQKRLDRYGTDAIARLDNPDFRRKARMNFWKPVSADDMKVFFAHIILLGLVHKPELEEYWSKKSLTRTPFFGQFMSRDRFQAIWSNLHLVDDTNNPPRGRPGHNPLAKLQPFIDMLNRNFKSAYKPGMNLSIDEGCCPYKGKLSFRMFNPRKPAKFHIKLFQVSDPATGYVVHFSVYTGKGSCHTEGNTSIDSLHSVTTKTVMTLCADAQVLDKGHCI